MEQNGVEPGQSTDEPGQYIRPDWACASLEWRGSLKDKIHMNISATA